MARPLLTGLFLLSIYSGCLRPANTYESLGQQNTVIKVCARGYFLSEMGDCLPCNCKGHAESCEDITGICMDCRDHTVGDFCESCEDGFLREVYSTGRQDCRPCACPLPLSSNNFAQFCDKRGQVLRCMCQEGYAGHYCERCAPGFYGNPMKVGDSCKKCQCNGNSDPNLIFNECNNVTGQCLHCWGNTAGDNCERCAPGFHGDAIVAKDCRACECNPCGTASCDDRTGVCHCKPGVRGRLCDQCEDGHSGFGSCMGCRRCECASAALKTTCHPLTLICQCRPGAGGRYCERCLPGHWDYSPAGCQKCDCPEGHCDMHTGECLPEPSQISECNINCDECIWHLIGDIRQSNKTLDQLKVSVLNISSGAAANDRLKYYNYTAQRLQNQFVGWRNHSAQMRRKTGHLEAAMPDLLADMEELVEQEGEVKSLRDALVEQALRSAMLAQTLTANLTSLNSLIEEMIRDWELYSIQQEMHPELERQRSAEAERLLRWMRTVSLNSGPVAMEESSEANELLRKVRQMEKRLQGTEGRLAPGREVLTRHRSKLSEAQDILQRAEDTVHQALTTHRANQLRHQRNEAQKQRLEESYEGLNDTIDLARDFITETETSLADMEAMAMNVSEYHAAMDGGSKLLMERTDNLSLADTELVLRANEHAEELQREAQQLEYNLKGSHVNGFVKKALDASNVYDNIVKFIDEANITGLTTHDLASRAEDAIIGVKSQLEFLVTSSGNAFKESVTLRSDYIEAESATVDVRKYIEETKEMLDSSKGKLAVIVNDMNAILTDRTPKRLQFTKEVAEETLNSSAEVLQTVTPMSERVEHWASNMRNNDYSTTAYERAVHSAGVAVENLSDLVPELLSKLRVVEEKKPVNNVSTNIVRIRELIAQARSVAKKVQVSMKFNGGSAVQVQPHPHLEDLKATTSISLYIRVNPETDPIEDRFILYLGDKQGRKDYMGLAIKNDNLVYVYNLGGEDVEIPLSSKPVSSWPPVFNLVKMERLGRHGKIFLTVPSQDTAAEQKFIQKGVADGTDSLFDLDPTDTVFVVGGLPPGITLPPALTLAHFVGCIELATLNNDVISLYNFKETHEMNITASVPCSRHKLAFSQSRVASYLFDGTGYALVSDIERRGRIGIVTRFDIEVRTVANSGILFLMVNGDNFFVLELKDGFLRLMYNFGFADGPVVMESNLAKLHINDARYHEVSIIYHHSKKVILLVDRSHVKSIENEKKTLPFSEIYIGGAPSRVLLSRPELSSLVGLKGCVKGFQFQKKDFNLLEEPGTLGISSGCPEESFMSREAYFTGQGYLGSTAKISPFDSFEGGLNFRTLQATGLLFHHSEGSDEFSISLENGAVVLNSKGTKVKSHKKNYNDGRSHFLVVSVTSQKYELVVDDKDKQEKNRPSSTATSDGSLKTFYYGGSPTSKIQNLTGCISYAYINRQDRDIEAEDFQRYAENVETSLQDCPVERPAVALITKPSRNTARTKQGASRKVGRDKGLSPQGLLALKNEPLESVEKEVTEVTPCYLSLQPRATRHAHHYGGAANSRHEYSDIADSIRTRSRFSLSLKTQSSFGLILYMSDAAEVNYMALVLSQGKLLYTFSVGQHQVRLISNEKYNDGRWHNVMLIRDGTLGRLVIDGLTVLEDRAAGTSSSWNVSDPLYIGGVAPGKAQENVQRSSASSFTGCVRSLQLNGRLLATEAQTFGVTPCFEGPAEPGTFFAEEGSYVVLDDSFSLGPKFELVMEVRPRVATALLLHVFTREDDYLTLYLHQGQVVVLVNNGIREFSTQVSPRSGVCDGNWHRITVIRDANVVQLDVDSEVNHVVGPVSPGAPGSKTPVFIGGAPESLLLQSVGIKRGFIGCMRNLTINASSVSFSKASLVSGAVNIGSCPGA